MVGRWNAPFHLPVVAIHTVVLPTGKVMLFSDRERVANTSQAWLWDPTSGALKRVDPPLWRDPADGKLKPANIWCGGQSFLADGRVLVAGGTLAYGTEHRGLNKAYTFDPWTESWTEQPDMRGGRWYPSQVMLADGRTVIMGGLNESGTGDNPDVELFTPSPAANGRGSMTLLRPAAGTPPVPGNYPHLFTMPSGRTLAAGPNRFKTWFLDGIAGSSFSWTQGADAAYSRAFGTAVLLPGGPDGSREVMQLGGSRPQTGDIADNTTEIYNETTNSWRPGNPMNVARGHHNTVLLPDGGMVAVGGGVGFRDSDGDGDGKSDGQWATNGDERQIELYDPATQTWRLGPEQVERRSYHSTAVLLPDGRVLSAGDDNAGGKLNDTGEIYEPPYLFKGPRPSIEFAPGAVRWGATFGVATPDADVNRAVLVAPAATTHATDMNQRFVPLSLARRADGRGVDLAAPPGPNVAPPGYYMLFLLNDRGVPSVARWVRLDAGAADEPLPDAAASGASARTPQTRRKRRPRSPRVVVHCKRACSIKLELRLGRSAARALHTRPGLVARGSRRLRRRGSAKVVVRLTARGRRRLVPGRRVALALRGRVVTKDGAVRREVIMRKADEIGAEALAKAGKPDGDGLVRVVVVTRVDAVRRIRRTIRPRL